MKVYQAQIAIGAARREGRQPNHDAEYLMLYWREGGEEWLLEDNAGVVASHSYNYREAVADANDGDEEMAEAEAIQAEIDETVAQPGELAVPRGLSTGPMGHEARNVARRLGWPINADGAYDEGAA